MNDDISIKVGGRVLSGWTSARVTRSIEHVASDFEVQMTDRYPAAGLAVVRPGDACEIYAGADLVITGYVDRYIPEFDARNHSIRVSGRSKTCDLVDCSAEWPGSQIMNGTVTAIAITLCKPFGISVRAIDDVGDVIPQTNLNVGDSPFDVIEPMARCRGLTLYDDPRGNLVFARAGKVRASSGFEEGVNVESAGMAYTMDNRFSKYGAYRVKMITLSELGIEANLISYVEDFDVARYRPKFIVAEANDGGFDIAERRATWELVRRKGRAAAVHVIVDSWRDSEGKLWTPNTLAKVALPSLKLEPVEWLISEVTYLRDAQGTHARVTLMHPSSFLTQPYNYQPFPTDLGDALKNLKK